MFKRQTETKWNKLELTQLQNEYFNNIIKQIIGLKRNKRKAHSESPSAGFTYEEEKHQKNTRLQLYSPHNKINKTLPSVEKNIDLEKVYKISSRDYHQT